MLGLALFNPWVILALLLSLAGLYGYGHHNGYTEATDEAKIAIAKLNDASRAKEQALNQQITDQSYAIRKAQDELARKKSTMYRLADTGRLRLPASRCVPTPQDSAPAAEDRPEAPSELEREAVRALIDIATDGDAAITQLNACIDAYNTVREQVNGQ